MAKKKKKKNKINPHILLRDFHNAQDYPQIAKAAGQWTKEHPGANRDDLLAWAYENYEAAPLLEMQEVPSPFTIFGNLFSEINTNLG